MKNKILIALVSLALIFFAKGNFYQSPIDVSAAAVDYFLKIDTIEGESDKVGFERQIEVLSWSWGESQAGLLLPAVQSAREAASGVVPRIQFEAEMSKASPQLFLAAAEGRHILNAELIGVRNAEDGSKHQFMIITMHDLLVSSYQTGGSSSSLPMDSFSLNFGKVEFEYKTKDKDGGEDETVKAGWDFKQNKEI